jgi:tyrosine-protein phosphatase 2/3
MDVFTEASASTRVSAEPATGSFANAIASHYDVPDGGGPGGVVGSVALRSPVQLPLTPRVVAMSLPALGSMMLSSPPRSIPTLGGSTSTFTPILPADLARLLLDPKVLVIDLRPHTAYVLGCVKGALGLAAPSTLLWRPAFGLDMLAGMVAPGENARAMFNQWRSAPSIVVYDADTTATPNASTVHGLLTKFAAQGIDSSRLRWIRGGFQSVCTTAEDVVDPNRLSEDNTADGSNTSVAAGSPVHVAGPGARGLLHRRGLPMQAFSLSLTTSAQGSRPSSQPSAPQAGSLYSPGFTRACPCLGSEERPGYVILVPSSRSIT